MLEFEVFGELFKVVTEIVIIDKWVKGFYESTTTKYTKGHWIYIL